MNGEVLELGDVENERGHCSVLLRALEMCRASVLKTYRYSVLCIGLGP